VDPGYRELILVMVQGALTDLPRQSLVMILDVDVHIEQVVDTDQTFSPLISQSPTVEIVVWPAVRVKNDQTREVHQLLLTEHRRGDPLLKRLLERATQLPVPDHFNHEAALELSPGIGTCLGEEPCVQVGDRPKTIGCRELAKTSD
jgi:hypothetical protein